jgi:Trypsin-like peptidase domain
MSLALLGRRQRLSLETGSPARRRQFRKIAVHMSHPPLFTRTPPEQGVHEFVSPLIAVRHGREEFVGGTAFLIGPGFALTAWHVIADYVERYEKLTATSKHVDISFEMLLFFSLDAGRDLMPMKVLRTWVSEGSDIAVLAVGIPPEREPSYRWRRPVLRLLPPKVGTPIAAFGFPESLAEDRTDKAHINLQLHPRTATGVVQDVHHERRDDARLKFPCYLTNARFDSGMSGGPVFDSLGHVCGVVCSGMPPFHSGGQHTSYAATLWPIVATMTDVRGDNVASGSYTPHMSQFQQGVFAAVDLSQVSVHPGQKGGWMPQASYKGSDWTSPGVPAVD